MLKYIKLSGMESSEVVQWCDNLRAVQNTNEEIWSPKELEKPEVDTILAINHTQKDLHNMDCRHAYTHRDTKKATKKKREVKKRTTLDCAIEQLTAKESDGGGLVQAKTRT